MVNIVDIFRNVFPLSINVRPVMAKYMIINHFLSHRHFNGLPVKGELTISAYAVFFSGLLQPVFSTPARKVVDINGQANVVYDLKTDLDLAEDAARPLVVEAVLEEYKTLIKQNVSSRILLLRTPYRLKVTAPDRFKPSLPYNVQVRFFIENYDNYRDCV